MKSLLLVTVSLLALSFSADAKTYKKLTPKQTTKVCKSLTAQAVKECEENMCFEQMQDADQAAGADQYADVIVNFKCEKDGDFYEGRGICVYDETLPDLIGGYNRKYPGARLNCDNE